MLDEQHRDVGGQARHDVEEFPPLGLRHARRRLVEQQDGGLRGEGGGDLDLPLLAIGQGGDPLVHDVVETEAGEDVGRLLHEARRGVEAGQGAAPSPRRSETTRAIISSGVMAPKSWLIWKVRAMPRFTRASRFSAVMSSPPSSTFPALGFSTPVRRLTKVVLPAPLGPISACRAPRSSRNDTSSVAVMPPKRMMRPRVSSAAVMTCLRAGR